jgi:hypothetical protein
MRSAGTEWAKKSPATRPLFERGWRRRWAYGAAVLAVVGSALALGGAHVYVVLATGMIIALAFVLALQHGSVRRVPLPAILLACLGLYSLLQSLPLPLALLDHLSPQAAEAWRRALRPLHETVSYGSISLEPGASCMEAVKWLSYAVLFTLAAAHAKRSGSSGGITLVFASAVILALATLGHRLAGATTVFGVYEPVFVTGRIGPMLNRNCLAGYLNLGIFCGLGLAFSTRQQAYRWLWLAGVAVLVGVVVLTGSRGGVAALIVGVLAFVWFVVRGPLARAGRSRRGLGDWAPLAAVAGGVAFSFLGARTGFEALFQQDVEKLKLSAWVPQMIRDYPVFGIGRGAFESVFPAYHAGAHNEIYTHPENIVAQWVTEWGPFVVLAAAVGFFWTLSPRRLGLGRSASSTGALVGICVLVLQNFVDLSLELMGPALAAVVILGSCWGDRNERRAPEREARRYPAPGLILAAALGLCLVFAAQRGLRPLSGDREAIGEQHVALAFEDQSAVRTLWSELREAMLRHPAEAYFPRVGALLALRTKTVDPMPWVQRALERSLTNGETHLIVGHTLARRGALHQALLECRIAVEYNPRLADRVGRAVVHWTLTPGEIELAAPRDAAGGNVLLVAAQQLAAPDQVDARRVLLRIAIERAPASPLPRRVLARDLLHDLSDPRCTGEVRSARIDEILSQARTLDAATPETADALEIFASLYTATSQPEEARRVLAPRCARLEGAEAVRCWKALLGVVRHSKDASAVVTLARQLTSTACAVDQQCHEALTQAADALADVSEWPLALSFYERAAQITPGANIFLKVAEVATKLGQLAVADRALTRAATHARGNAKLGRVIAERRQALYRTAAINP